MVHADGTIGRVKKFENTRADGSSVTYNKRDIFSPRIPYDDNGTEDNPDTSPSGHEVQVLHFVVRGQAEGADDGMTVR